MEYAYDRLGRRVTVTQKNLDTGEVFMSHALAYDGVEGQPRSETITAIHGGAPWTKLITRERTYPHPPNPPPPGWFGGYLEELSVGTAADPRADYAAFYAYGGLGRLGSVSGDALGGRYVQYAYQPGSDLVKSAEYRADNITLVGSATREYEEQRNLIEWVENRWGGQLVSKYAYQNDALGRRKNVVRTGSAFGTGHLDAWNYNDRSELTSSSQYASTDPASPQNPDGSRTFGYSYDPIGNRQTASVAVQGYSETYTANHLNQYTLRTSTAGANQSFTHDGDGHLTNDGLFVYTWDAENRLITVVPASPPVSGSKKLEFAYDYMNRRVRKQVFTHNGSGWPATPTSDTRFVYDQWNVLLELDGLNTGGTGVPQVIRKYTWGLDLSGSLHGAGGIGGLLAMQATQGTATPVDDANYAYFYDANGNVGQLIDTATGAVVATYEYDPYGNALVADGPMADANPFRFSTKFLDAETEMYYYGYRYYLSRMGRWSSRDPLGEAADPGLVHFVRNRPTMGYDRLGLLSNTRPLPGGGITVRGPEAKIVSFVSSLSFDNSTPAELAELLQARTGRNSIVAFSAVMIAVEELVRSANPPPPNAFSPASWDTFVGRQEYRAFSYVRPVINCNCSFVTSVRLDSNHSFGWTPLRFDGQTPTDRYEPGEGFVEVSSESTIANSCHYFRFDNQFQVGKFGQLVALLATGVPVPWPWHTIEYRLCCDGAVSVKYSGSHFPSHWAYLNNQLVGSKDGTDLAGAVFAGPVRLPGGEFRRIP